MGNIRLVDRSRIVCDWTCPRKRFWNYEYKGKGISKSSTNLALFTGIITHDSLANIAIYHKEGKPVDIDLIAETARKAMFDSLSEATAEEVGSDVYAHEQASLTEGMIRGFHKYVWPRLIAQYPNIVAIEQECEYPINEDLIFMSKPDLLLADDQGNTHYIEYKTTSSKKVEWINSWNTAVQLHSSVKAVEHTLGAAPSDVIIVGLYKGYSAYGKQNSPFCYAYKKNGVPPFIPDEVQYEYKAGFKKYPTWELEGGVKEWVNGMPDEVLADLFPMTPNIFYNDSLVTSFFAQVEAREFNISTAMKALYNEDPDNVGENNRLLDVYFPQRFDQCSPAYGFQCEFMKLCHGFVADPLSEGFQPREPHHKLEEDQHAE